MNKNAHASRQVKRGASLNINRQVGKSPVKPVATLKKVPVAARKTKTRRYLLYAFGCLVAMQVIKFIVYTYVWPGSTSPEGLPFLLVIYLQIGLMLAAFAFVVAASISYLHKVSQS